MGHFFSKVSLFIDKKEAAAHLILDQDFATAPFFYFLTFSIAASILSLLAKFLAKAVADPIATP